MTTRNFHGIEVEIPGSWSDHSVYRFAPSPAEADQVNLTITEHQLPRALSIDELFAEPNQMLQSRLPSFQQVRAAETQYRGQRCAFQDLAFLDPQSQSPIQQRQIVVFKSDTEVVTLTLTSMRDDLDTQSAALGFSPDQADS